MIIPDTNLLLYATDDGSPFHRNARKWWQQRLSGDGTIGLCNPVIFAYARLSTHPKVFRQPLSVMEAFSRIDNWFQFPNVEWLQPDASHRQRVGELLLQTGTGGNLVTDAEIAAFSIQYHATVHTADLDFGRFSSVRWENPLLVKN